MGNIEYSPSSDSMTQSYTIPPCRGRVINDHEEQDKNEISGEEGDDVIILKKEEDNNGRWYVEIDGVRGLFPKDKIEEDDFL